MFQGENLEAPDRQPRHPDPAGNQHHASTGGISLWAFVLISRGSVGREEKDEKLRTELGICRTYKTAASFTFF